MRIIEDIKLDYSDVLFVPKRSSLTSRKHVVLERKHQFLHTSNKYNGIGIISANMDHTGTFEMARALSALNVSTALHKHYTADELITFFSDNNEQNHIVFYSMGISKPDYDKFKQVYINDKTNISAVCIDVANGYTTQFEKYITKIRNEFPKLTIMAGSVVTPEMTEQLLLAGADIIRVGIGGGSVCTTRKLTGVGYPQLSAVIECADAAHGLQGHICADGGCTIPGDISKAFGAGADFVMLGGLLAGHKECNGELVYPSQNISEGGPLTSDEPTHMQFYGMSSVEAMKKHAGGVANYRAAEGKSVLVPYRGGVKGTMHTILGGMRSTCTYVGAVSLKELSKRTTFIRVHNTHNTIFGDE